MRVEQFPQRHGIIWNPFATSEEAQGDQVLLDVLSKHEGQFGHPKWPKFCGDPPGNQTSFVFGKKGSGKTAMRIALEERIKRYNSAHTDRKVLLLLYTHFNPYLNTWKTTVEQTRNPKRRWYWPFRTHQPAPVTLKQDWYLADHLDAILAEAAAKLCTVIKESAHPRRWDTQVKHDILLLLAIYLPLHSDKYKAAFTQVRRTLFSVWARAGMWFSMWWRWWGSRSTAKHLARVIRVVGRDVKDTAWALRRVPRSTLHSWSMSNRGTQAQNEQPRREVLSRYRSMIDLAGYTRVVVIVDRVDEPTMIHGDYTLMSDFVLPLLDNQILQTEGVSFKLLLPSQVYDIIRKADADKANIIRADKANVVYPFEWSGEALYDILSERMAVCAHDGQCKNLHELFEPSLSRERIIAELNKMETPRYAGKFMEWCLHNACARIVSEPNSQDKPRILQEDFFRASQRITDSIRDDKQTLREF